MASDDSGLHPLFMSGNEAPDAEKLEALQVLLSEEDPRDVADRCRHNGNEQVKAGRCFWTRAVGYYTQGIETECEDKELMSVLYANRAHVHLLKGNLRSATLDCDEAIALNPLNVKAYYRGAKASQQLSKWGLVLKYAQAGLQHEPDNADLVKFASTAQSKIAEQERIASDRMSAEQKKKAEEECTRTNMESRGLMVCGMDRLGGGIEEMKRAKPYVDAEGQLHWPLLIMYPEYGQTDFILDANENDVLGSHLEEVLQEQPPWDVRHEYTLDRLVVYFATCAMPPTIGLAHWKRLKSVKSHWERIDPNDSIAAIVAHPEHVVPGCPVVQVMVAGSPYHEKFLQSEPR